MCETRNCYRTCINEKYLLDAELTKQAIKIITELDIKSITGRPPLDFIRALNGIYYILKTGIPWKALPKCFGSSSAVHRTFKKLVSKNFFRMLWNQELQDYNNLHGLELER